jgi:hypothetical protein
MDSHTAARIAKVYNAIANLPVNPTKHIYWIVYSQDMVEYTEKMIATIKGEEYLEKYVTVVAKSAPSKERTAGFIYFDPGLPDLLTSKRY